MAVFVSVLETQKGEQGPSPNSHQKENEIGELLQQWLTERLAKKRSGLRASAICVNV